MGSIHLTQDEKKLWATVDKVICFWMLIEMEEYPDFGEGLSLS